MIKFHFNIRGASPPVPMARGEPRVEVEIRAPSDTASFSIEPRAPAEPRAPSRRASALSESGVLNISIVRTSLVCAPGNNEPRAPSYLSRFSNRICSQNEPRAPSYFSRVHWRVRSLIEPRAPLIISRVLIGKRSDKLFNYIL